MAIVDTNALIQVALQLIAGFAEKENLGQQYPHSTNDIATSSVGIGHPVSVSLQDKMGSEFVVSYGNVQQMKTLGSFFHLHDAGLIPSFKGKDILGEAKAVAVASNFVSKLVKNGNPLKDARTDVEPFEEPEYPFYRIRWPAATATGYAADVEIDGRSGAIVSFQVAGKEFRDMKLTEELMRKHYRPPERKPRPPQTQWPRPDTNIVTNILHDYPDFQRRMELVNPQRLTEVDWDQTYYLTNIAPLTNLPFCRIYFKDGGFISSRGDKIVGFAAADSKAAKSELGLTPEEDIALFTGQVEFDWTEVAKDVERRCRALLDVSSDEIAKYRAIPSTAPPGKGEIAQTTLAIGWFDVSGQKPNANVPISQLPMGFMGEVNLKSGTLEAFTITDPGLIEKRVLNRR